MGLEWQKKMVELWKSKIGWLEAEIWDITEKQRVYHEQNFAPLIWNGKK